MPCELWSPHHSYVSLVNICVHFFQLHTEKWNCWVRSLKMLPSGFCCCYCVCAMLPVLLLWYWCLNSGLHLLGRHATFCVVTPITLLVFFFFFFKYSMAFCPGWPGPWSSSSYLWLPQQLRWQAWVTTLGFFCWECVSQTFCPGWPGILILLNSASCIPGMMEIYTIPKYWLRWGLANLFAWDGI
jgi:hypothetical protein